MKLYRFFLFIQWIFPLQFPETISGDGTNVYMHKINLNATLAFGQQKIRLPINLTNRKWVRLEAWDIAANGAFTQTVWICYRLRLIKNACNSSPFFAFVNKNF